MKGPVLQMQAGPFCAVKPENQILPAGARDSAADVQRTAML